MAKTLLTATELAKFTIPDTSFPLSQFRNLALIEAGAAHTYLGQTFYDTMLADLAEYDYTTWQAGTYSEGDFVEYQGQIYEALAETNAVPSNKTYWAAAQKFESECYNAIWCDMLGPFLAWTVLSAQLPLIHTQFKQGGIGKIYGENLQPAEYKDYQSLVKASDARANTALMLLDKYIKANSTNTCYSAYKGLCANACDNCGECECECSEREKPRKHLWKVAQKKPYFEPQNRLEDGYFRGFYY